MSRRREISRPRSSLVNINTYLPQLVEYLDVVNLATYLLAVDLITHEERRAVLGLETKHHQVPELMRLLQTKGGDWYARFRDALTRASLGSSVHLGHKNLVEDILPESLEKHPEPRKSASQQESSLQRELMQFAASNDSETSACKCFHLLSRLLLQKQSCVDGCCQRTSHAPSGICHCQVNTYGREPTGSNSVFSSSQPRLGAGQLASFTCAHGPKQSDLPASSYWNGSNCSDYQKLSTQRIGAGDAGRIKLEVHGESDCSTYAINMEDGLPTETSCDAGLSLGDRACKDCCSAPDGEDSAIKTFEANWAECQKLWKKTECGVKKQVQGLQTEKGLLKRENERLQSENERLRSDNERVQSENEALKKRLAERESDREMQLQKLRELELELQRARAEEGMEQFAGQQVLQSATLEEVQSLKSLPGEQAARLCCRRQKGPFLRHLKLLVLGDFGGNPHESRARMAECAHTVDALLGNSQDIWPQDSPDPEKGVAKGVAKGVVKGMVRTHRREKLHTSCSVRVTTVTTDLSDSVSLPSSFSPDLTLFCLENSAGKLQGYQESLQRLASHVSPTVWEHCVVALPPGAGKQDCVKLKRGFLEALNRLGVGTHVSSKIPFAITPDSSSAHPYWVNHCVAELYAACVERALPSSRASLVQLNRLRLKPSNMVDYATLPSSPMRQPLPLTHYRMGRLQRAMAGDARHQCCLKTTACKLTAPLVGKLCRRECKS